VFIPVPGFAHVIITVAASADSRVVLYVLLTAWYDEFINSKTANCVVLRVPTECAVAVNYLLFRRQRWRSGTSCFRISEYCFDLEFSSGKLAVECCKRVDRLLVILEALLSASRRQ